MNQAKTPVLLLADDDRSVTESLAPYLERSGFHVIVKENGLETLEWVQSNQPDLIILDILMPLVDGREVLRRMRGQNIWIPTILLTQIGDSSERADALDEGADDYLNKPFHPQELVSRIRAVLRRVQKGQPSLSSVWELKSNGLVLDRRARRLSVNGQVADISPKAFAVLEYLMTHPDEVVSRERLLKSVWGWDYPIGTRTVDNRIFELRKALNDDVSSPKYIETSTGQGYCYIAPVKRS